jgi:hypothetical protein
MIASSLSSHSLATGQCSRATGQCSRATDHWPLFSFYSPLATRHLALPPTTLYRWLLPSTDRRIDKDRTRPDLKERPHYSSMSPNQAICSEVSVVFSPLATVRALTIRSWPEVLNARGFRRAGRMAVSRKAFFLLALPDFPGFARTLRQGVHGALRVVIRHLQVRCRKAELIDVHEE